MVDEIQAASGVSPGASTRSQQWVQSPACCLCAWLVIHGCRLKPCPGVREHEPKLLLKWSGQGEHFLAVSVVKGGCSRPRPEPGWQCGPRAGVALLAHFQKVFAHSPDFSSGGCSPSEALPRLLSVCANPAGNLFLSSPADLELPIPLPQQHKLKVLMFIPGFNPREKRCLILLFFHGPGRGSSVQQQGALNSS